MKDKNITLNLIKKNIFYKKHPQAENGALHADHPSHYRFVPPEMEPIWGNSRIRNLQGDVGNPALSQLHSKPSGDLLQEIRTS